MNNTSRLQPEETFWSPYKDDVDRIINSKAFRRYTDKTQVIYLVENDHLTYRSLHVQLVSAYARGLGSKLHLDIDLIEAISLGHDVGHAPFGHEGEVYLSELSRDLNLGSFCHARQSCRLLAEIEPLNLTFAVLDGFLCHDGGLKEPMQRPAKNKTWNDFSEECELRRKTPDVNLAPATMEGALVKICDTISYIGKDLEDAVNLKIISQKDVPHTILGATNREILHTLGQGIISESLGKDYIAMRQDHFEALQILRAFNFEHIYMHPKLKVESKKIRAAYRSLYHSLLADYEENQEKSVLVAQFLHSREEGYLAKTSLEQKIIDYIAGMTDSYFVNTLKLQLIPQPITL